MNWLFWAARLWVDYQKSEAESRSLHNLKQSVTGAGFAMLGFLLGSCSLVLLLLSSFFFFADQPKYALAVFWTAIISSSMTAAAAFFGNRFFGRMIKA